MTFSAVTTHILRAAGWHPDRRVDPGAWIERIRAAGYDMFDLLESTLANLGGLFIDPMPFHRQPFSLDNGQEMVLNHWSLARRIDIRPEVSDDIWSVARWKSIQYVQRRRLQIAPLGSVWYPNANRQTVFLLSNGSVMSTNFYHPDPARSGIFSFMKTGDSIHEALNSIFQEDAMYR